MASLKRKKDTFVSLQCLVYAYIHITCACMRVGGRACIHVTGEINIVNSGEK